MNLININDYYRSIDYLLFGIGFSFISLGLLLMFFFKKRGLIKKEKNFPLFILYMIFFGVSSWNDLTYLYFPDYLFFDKGQYIFKLVAYISLLEFSRRELKLKKKTISIYGVFLLLFLINPNIQFLVISVAFISMVFSSNAIWLKLHRNKNKFNLKSRIFKIPNLILISLLFTLILKGIVSDQVILKNLQLIEYVQVWSFAYIISIILAKYILSFVPNDPLEIQLRKLRLRLLKISIVILLAIYVIGLFYINNLEQKQFNDNTFIFTNGTRIASLGIDSENYQQLIKNQFENNDNYIALESELNEIANKFRYANNVYTLYNENGKLFYGIGNKTLKESPGQPYESTFDLSQLQSDETLLDNNGKVITSFAPINNNQGEIIGILAIDTPTNHVVTNSKSKRLTGIVIILLAFITVVFMLIMYYLNKRQLTWRTNHLKILSSIGDIVGIFDINGEIIYANKAAINLIGAKDSIKKENIYLKDFLDADNSYKVFNIIKNLPKDKVIHTELTLHTIDKKSIPIYGSISYLDYEHNDTLYVFTAMNISEQKEREKEISSYFHNTLSLLATVVDAKDYYTAKHSTNVAEYAKKIATELKLDKEKIQEIEIAAFIHDIGKIAIPDRILKKNGPLNEDEWLEMKKHPEYGKQILEKAGSTFDRLIPYVYHHHERYDGKGYPEGIKDLPLEVAIISVADAYDAMTSNRSYRNKMSIQEAMDELTKYSGTQFNPVVVDSLIRILEQEIDITDYIRGLAK